MSFSNLAFLPALPLLSTSRTSLFSLPSSRQPLPTAPRLRTARLRTAPIHSPTCSAPLTSPSPKTLFSIQNGSDVRGVALSIPPANSAVTISAAHAREIAAAFVRHVRATHGAPPGLRVALGRDSRLSGPELAAAVAEGAASEGASVTDFGLATTPAMFMSTVIGGEWDAALMLTASHLPPDRNGIKFFTARGGLDKKGVRDVLEDAVGAVERRGWLGGGGGGEVATDDFMAVYAAHLVGLIREGCGVGDRPLEGFRLVVDAGNGAAGFFKKDVLEELGAEVFGQFLEPDGTFPNHIPNPEDPEALRATAESTTAFGADLGVVFDTDGDRSAVVDSEGRGFNRNHLIALIAAIVLREHPGTTIVTDSVTSNGLKRFIESRGGKHFRYRKGYKNVIDKGVELNEAGTDCQLQIETSGHGAMKENYFLDDGAYLAVKIIIEMVNMRQRGDSGGIGGLLDGLETPVEENEFRLDFVDRQGFQEYGADVVEAFAEFVGGVEGWTLERENYEGYRVSVDEGNGKEGWLLLRQSLHDPLLPLNIESEVEGGVEKIAKILVHQFLPKWDNIDPSSLVSWSQ